MRKLDCAILQLQAKAASRTSRTTRELWFPCWTNLNAAVSYTNPIPSSPELSVFASVGKTDESHPWSIVPENMNHLKTNSCISYIYILSERKYCKNKCIIFCEYLTPVLIIPLFKIDGRWGKCLDRLLFLVQQLYTDLILAATIPSWSIPVTYTSQHP